MGIDFTSHTFGTILVYNYLDSEEKFIFLGFTPLKFVYLAKILSQEQTKNTERLKKIHNDAKGPTEEFALWYIKLTTEEFKDLIALLTNAQKDESEGNHLRELESVKLNKEDKIKLRDEILNAPIWEDLKEYVRGIEI